MLLKSSFFRSLPTSPMRHYDMESLTESESVQARRYIGAGASTRGGATFSLFAKVAFTAD
jgi:hypothetical protein